MALTNLTSLTAEQYHALNITPFLKAPGRSSSGSPDSRISFQLAGFVGTSVMAFTVTNQANITTSLNISTSSTTNTLVASVNRGSNPASLTTYWTVDMGLNASSNNWGLSFQVDDGNTDTGTWVFTKGSGGDIDY
ncbi:MAG: hypothetical protein IPP15_10690 [Saprospiraceae bacterium]|uniref:Uncharacterized protein n=1 Tax=Candidatus Opimibacter skivensis TaxID=2982028 RepID=A0A9D7SVR7_9BACT|nr:hypothetical protein [Candidatus Opimibacter skivensis]